MYRGPDRKLNRWQGYDYKYPGLYFVTICIRDKQLWFGDISNYLMELNEVGKMVRKQWLWLQENFSSVRLDEFTVMPNHLHGIIEIQYDFEKYGINSNDIIDNDGKIAGNERANDGRTVIVGNGRDRSLRMKPLPDIIGAFKTTSSKLIHQNGHNDFAWQKSFHDRVIRDEDELSRIRDYIISNPAKWAEDRNNPGNLK